MYASETVLLMITLDIGNWRLRLSCNESDTSLDIIWRSTSIWWGTLKSDVKL